MIPGLPLDFVSPALLTALLALPALWWLLRLMPPRPRRIAFPPTRILFDIKPKEETPARTPWWLTALRLLLAALIILAAAGPIWNPAPAGMRASGPVVVLLDSGWASAASWEQRIRAANEIINRAENDRRPVALIASGAPQKDASLLRPGEARDALRLVTPTPYTPVRADALAPLSQLLRQHADASVIWLSDGVDTGDGADFVKRLNEIAGDKITVVTGGIPTAHALKAPDNTAGGLTVKVLRTDESAPVNGTVRARDLRGLLLGEVPFSFKGGELETEARFDLPVEIRNDIARVEIANERSAGAVQLLDKRWRRRTVGIVSGGTVDTRQPLLSASFYLTRALGPFADVRTAESAAPSEAISHFIDQRLPVMILSDVGTIAPSAREKLERWIDDGGLLIRFAGPRLAAVEDDELVPVRLRRGGRVLGGSLSWEQPQHLGAFPRESPFHGLSVPEDVTVSRQVLAEPDGQLPDRTWAALADGTPLVTSTKRGKGLLVLFHVAADTRWSNLPISGTFVEMLRKTIALAGTTAEETPRPSAAARPTTHTIAPSRLLDGFGTLIPPGPTARPIPADFNEHASADHPPGFYGPPENFYAVNTLAAGDKLAPLDFGAMKVEPYRQAATIDLRAATLAGVMLLMLADGLIVFWLSGGASRLAWRRAGTAALIAIAIFALGDGRGFAQSNTPAPAKPVLSAADDFALRATLQTRLAYVITGDNEVDNISRSGLEGLSLFLAQRTALEPGDPMGVDPARDELAFFPILYWPITPEAVKPTPEALAKIDAYMKQGGTILFDTRDAFASFGRGGGVSPALAKLREILSSLDIPELEPVPQDHVLTKSFFLLRDFPGRFATGKLWVEALPGPSAETETRPARAGDGVSPILITSNDFAGAWAINPDGQPLLPITQNEPRQREFAYRAGTNIVMYVLTGNYKADQVHAPALIERLGQ
jgi:hypothetical protein